MNQSWEEIELIITDDCSTDQTVDLCKKWLNEREYRFVNSKIITFKNNTGVAANANRGLHCSTGEWIVFLAGDDALKPDCIENNMLWIVSHYGIKVLFSQIEIYMQTFDSHNLLKTTPAKLYNTKGFMASDRTPESQYKMLLLCDRIHYTPSVFLHRETILNIGGFDERFSMLEDYPMWLKLTKSGHKLYFMDKVTINYRQHPKAINNTGRQYLINPNFFRQEEFRKVYTYPYLPADIRLNGRFYWFSSQIFRCGWINRDMKLNKILLVLLTAYLNPFKYYIYIRKLLNKNLKNDEFYM